MKRTSVLRSAKLRACGTACAVLLLWHLCAFYAFNLDDVNSPEEQQLEDELDEDSESGFDDDGFKAEATLAPITNADKDHLWQLGHKLITIRDKVMQLDPEILDWQMLPHTSRCTHIAVPKRRPGRT